MTKAGYVKAVPASQFRTQGRGGRGVQGARLKDEDLVTRIIHTSAHAYLLFFSNRGKVYRLRAYEVPVKERTARGTAIVNLLPLEAGRADPGPDRHPGVPRRPVPAVRHQGRAGQEDHLLRVRQVPPGGVHRHQPARRRRAGRGDHHRRRRRHLHGVPPGHGHPLRRDRRAAHGPRRGRRAGHAAADRRRGGVRRSGPGRHQHPDRHRRRLRQAHPAPPLQPAGPRRPRASGASG